MGETERTSQLGPSVADGWPEEQAIMTDPIRSSTPSHHYAIDANDSESAESNACREEKIELGRAGVAVAGSVAALVAAAPTAIGVLPGIAAFIGASAYTGQALAEYLDCRDVAASKAE
jgi:hypothetical protein